MARELKDEIMGVQHRLESINGSDKRMGTLEERMGAAGERMVNMEAMLSRVLELLKAR